MPRRSSKEAVIQEYFDNEPLVKCDLMLNLITAKVKSRKKAEQPKVEKPQKQPTLIASAQ